MLHCSSNHFLPGCFIFYSMICHKFPKNPALANAAGRPPHASDLQALRSTARDAQFRADLRLHRGDRRHIDNAP